MLEMAIRRAARMVLSGGVVKVARAVYDFSVHGGAVGTISLVKNIPAHATIIGIRTVERTALAGTDTSERVQFKAGTTALTAALAVTAFTGVDVHALSTVDGIKVAVESDLKFVVSIEAITAGKLDIFVQYLEGNPA